MTLPISKMTAIHPRLRRVNRIRAAKRDLTCPKSLPSWGVRSLLGQDGVVQETAHL